VTIRYDQLIGGVKDHIDSTSNPHDVTAHQIGANAILAEIDEYGSTTVGWDKVDKTGSSLADLATRNYSDLSNPPGDDSFHALTEVSSSANSDEVLLYVAGTTNNYRKITKQNLLSGVSISSDKIYQGDTKAEVHDAGSDGYFWVETEGTEKFRINQSGNVGIGQVSPTAKLHISAGTPSANTAPIKLTSGTAMSTPEDGAVEYHSSHLYFTIGSTRYQIDQQSGGGGSGDVVGPSSATNEAIVRFDTTTGKLIQNSLVIIGDDGYVSIPSGQKYKINGVNLSAADVGAEPTQTKGTLSSGTSSALSVSNGSSSTVGPNVSISINKASASQDGYLGKDSFSVFSGKEPALTKGNLTESSSSVLIFGGATTNNVIGAGTSIQVKKASISQDGYLGKDNWNVFNSKESVLTFQHSLTRSVNTINLVGDSASPGNSQYYGTNGIGTKGWYSLTSGSGDVVGPSSATNEGVVRFDTTTGKLIQNSLVIIGDDGYVSIPSGQKYKINGVNLSAVDVGAEPTLSKTNLTESTSSVLTIAGGTGTVLAVGGTTIQVKKASISQDGYLGKDSFSVFNSKEPALTKGNLTEASSSVLTFGGTTTNNVIGAGTTIQVKKASSSQDGYLAKGDWTIFNGKASLNTPIFTSKITVGVASGSTGSIELKGTTSGTCTITVPSIAGTPTYVLPAAYGTAGQVLSDAAGNGILSWATVSGGGANAALSNLSSVAINTTLLPGSNDGAGLGNGLFAFADLFLASGGVINFNNGNVTLTHSAGTLTLSGALALGTNSITMTGSIGVTGSRVTKGWFTDLEVSNDIAGSITGNAATVTGLSVVSGKTLTCSNILTLSGTDGSSLAIGTGGTLGTAAYTASTAYEISGAVSSHASLQTGIHGISITAGKTLTCSNILTLSGTDGSSLAIGTGGTLGTGAYATISNYATLATPIFTSKITIGVASGSTGSIELKGTTSGTCTITVPSVAGSPTYVLPASYGTAGQVLADAAGNGILSWATASGGFTDPMTTNGDIIIRSGDAANRLGIGSTGQVLTVLGGLPSWQSASGGSSEKIYEGDTKLEVHDTGSDGYMFFNADGVRKIRFDSNGTYIDGYSSSKGFIEPISSKSSGYTTTVNDYTLLVTTGASDVTIILSSTAAKTGQIYVIKKVDSGVGYAILSPSSGTIDGQTTHSVKFINDSRHVQFDGTNWKIITTYSDSFVWKGTTTDDALTEIFVDGVSNSRYGLTTSSTSAFELTAIARDNTNNKTKVWLVKAVATTSSAGTSSIVGAQSYTVVAQSDVSGGTDGWLIGVDVNDTDDTVRVSVHGQIGTTIQWVVSN
jgi:hypothetical protein